MARIARVLVADCDLETLNLVSDRLRTRNFVNLLEMTGRQAISRVKSERPDAVILGVGFEDPSIEEIVAELKGDPDTQRIPVLLVDRGTDGPALTEALALQVEGYVMVPCSEEELFANINSALRLGIMQSELMHRATTMRAYGVEDYDCGLTDEFTGSLQILIASAGDTQAIERALEGAAELEKTDEFVSIGLRLADHSYEAVIIDAGDDVQEALTCCEDIRRIPTLYHFPVLLICGPDAFSEPAIPYRRGITGILTTPFKDSQLRARMTVMVKRERLRRRILEACRSSGRPETNDPLTGVFSEHFLHKHLELLVEDAFRWDKSLSLTVIYMPEIHRVRVEFGDRSADTLFRQVGDAVSRLVRGEDLCARLGEAGFCVVLPETTLEATSIIMQRLSGVVSFSEFALPEVNRPMTVHPRLASAEYRPGDTPVALLGRALVATADAAA